MSRASVEQTSSDVGEAPNNQALDEFKSQVRMWMDLDNEVKQLTQFVKEKKVLQKKLSESILHFMSQYNIEDLNTRDGKLRYKVSQVKPPVKKAVVKERLLEYFDDKTKGEQVAKQIFDNEGVEKVQKVSLRRLKGVRVMNV
jgi:hypothetical protein